MKDKEHIEMHDLLDGLVENNLSIVQKKRLQFLLETSEEARILYIRFLDMSASLKYFSEELVGDDEEAVVSNGSRGEKIIRFPVALLGLAALILIGFYISFPFFDKQEKVVAETAKSSLESVERTLTFSDNSVAVLTKSVGLKWSDQTGFRPEDGASLEPSNLKISEGLVQLEFLKGSTVILEGPVDFQILNQNEGLLKQGKLRATVPEVARGFTVALPKGKVIDLGTEFGLQVHMGGATEIFVYRGEVLYSGKADSGEEINREISGGEALFVNPYGFANWVEMPSEAFIGTADLAFRSREESQLRHEGWVQLSEEISHSSNTSLYFTFYNHSPWSRVLSNRVEESFNPQNAAIVGCKWTEGRWPGKGALEFTKKSDMVRMNFHENLNELTFSCWVKIDGLTNNVLPILCSESETTGSIFWFINSKGQLVLEINRGGNKDAYHSAVAFRKEKVGRWMHIATTLDWKSGMVSHFVNGRSFSREKITEKIPIKLSSAFLGHLPRKESTGKKITIKGSIDEFAIFKVSMPESEIRRIYEIGCPYDMPNLLGPKLP